MALECAYIAGPEQPSEPTEPSVPPVETIPQPAEPNAASKPASPPIGELFTLDPEKADNEAIQDIVRRQVEFNLASTRAVDNYNILLLYDSASIGPSDSSRLYSALADADRDKPVLLILSSPGGDIAAAYFIAKLCHEHTSKSFEVAVPRQAKSAATLICCGADKIHMGSLSELGPIDPQFGNIPALALKQSVEHIAQLVSQYPGAADMFSEYLRKSLRIEALGYYERVAESATQYAIRLLGSRRTGVQDVGRNQQIARQLVYEYKDHGFAIDQSEASTIFGSDIVVCNTGEYKAANALFQSLDIARWLCDARLGRTLSYIGSVIGGCWVFSKKRQ